MFKLVVFSAFIALCAGQPVVPRYGEFASPWSWGGQSYDGRFFFAPGGRYDFFRGQNFFTFVNAESQPVGYVYDVDSDAVSQYRQRFVPVRDVNGYVFGYFSRSQYTPGQEFVVEPVNEDVASQLAQWGVIYVPQSGKVDAVFIFRNPYVLNYHKNGVVTPRAWWRSYEPENNSWGEQYGRRWQHPAAQWPQRYEYEQYQVPHYYRYQQQYTYPYSPEYQSQYYPYNYNYYQYAY